MLKEKFLEKIMEKFEGEAHQRNNFYAYISGATNELPDSLEHMSTRKRWEIESLLFTYTYEEIEIHKVIDRILYALSEKRIDMLIRIVHRVKGKYARLKRAGVKADFIIQDMLDDFAELCGDAWSKNLTEYLNILAQEIKEHYPECIAYFLNKRPLYRGNSQFATCYFLADAMTLEENKAYEELTEELIIDIMVSCFTLQSVRSINDQFGREEKINTYLIKDNFIPFFLSQEILYQICYILADGTKVLKEMARLAMILFEAEFFTIGGRRQDKQRFYSLWEKLEVPREVYLRYFAWPLNKQYANDLKEGYEQMYSVFINSKDTFVEILDKAIKNNEIYALNILSIVLESGSLSSEQQEFYKVRGENVLVTQLKSFITEENSIFVFRENENEEEVLNNLKSKTFHKSKISIDQTNCKHSICDHPFSNLAQACIGLIRYSDISCNVVKLLLNELQGYNLSFIQFWEKYSYYTGKTGLNALNTLFEAGFGVEMLCKLVVTHSCYPSCRHKEKSIIEQEVFVMFLTEHKELINQLVEQVPYEKEIMNPLLKCLYDQDLGFSDSALVKVLNTKSKAIALYAEALLLKRENTIRADVEAVSKGKGKVAVDIATRLLRNWDNQKMEAILCSVTTMEALEQLVEERYTKVHEKNAPYSQVVDYAAIRAKGSEDFVSERLIKYFVAEYILLKDFYVIKLNKKISETVNPYDLQKFLEQLYSYWIADGAKTAYKNIMFPYALLASQPQLTQLKKRLDKWSSNGNYELATFGVQCLGMNGSKLALLWTDTFSKKHKNKKVRQAALEAMEALAKEWGVSQEVLEDEIVPDFGFDENRGQSFSYGERTIGAVLNNDLTITLSDEEGKVIRSMPRASQKYHDKEELVAAAKEEMTAIKKQIQGVFDTQVLRITKAVFTGRSWSREKWEQLFVKNPLMLAFATGLIWEERSEEGSLIGCFRYMEDGSFNNLEEDEYQLQEGTQIALLHPSNIVAEEVGRWREQLEDYEITQPIVQLELLNTVLGEEILQQNELKLYEGKKVYGATVKSLASKLSFKLSFGEYGWCDGIFFEDENTGICLKMDVEAFDLSDYKQVTTLGSIHFREDKRLLQVASVPKRLLSLACYMGSELCKKLVIQPLIQ